MAVDGIPWGSSPTSGWRDMVAVSMTETLSSSGGGGTKAFLLRRGERHIVGLAADRSFEAVCARRRADNGHGGGSFRR